MSSLANCIITTEPSTNTLSLVNYVNDVKLSSNEKKKNKISEVNGNEPYGPLSLIK